MATSVRTGPRRIDSLDPAKTARLLHKRPKHSSSPAPKQQSLALNKSAPELHERDDLSITSHERPTSAPLLPSHPPLSHRGSGKRIPKQHKLDRIDELDESSPLGIALHHGGPYEAAAQKKQHPSSPPPKAETPTVVSPSPALLPPTEVLIKPTDVLPEQSPSGAMSLHLLPGQILPTTILRSYQSQQSTPSPIQYSLPQQPDFDPYAPYAYHDPAPSRPPQRHVPPHRAHLPPRHRDRQNAAAAGIAHPHSHHRNMGPRMSQAVHQPMLAMPTPQRPHSQYFEQPQQQQQQLVPPVNIPQMTISLQNDAFSHLPPGVLRMNTPSPPPVEPQRNPLLTPTSSSFDLQVQSGLVRRQSLPARAPQRAVPERPNPTDAFFREAAPLPSVASAPTIAPFYQQSTANDAQSASSSSSSSHHTQAPPPSYSSHSQSHQSSSSSSGFNGPDMKGTLHRSGSSGADLDKRPRSRSRSRSRSSYTPDVHPTSPVPFALPYPSQFAEPIDAPPPFIAQNQDNLNARLFSEASYFNPYTLYSNNQRSVNNAQLPTPPDESPTMLPVQRELSAGYNSATREKQQLKWRMEILDGQQQQQQRTLAHGLPTPESTPSPPQMGRMRSISGGLSPILADYMSADAYSRESRDREENWGVDTRASHGHEPPLQHRLSVRAESSWSDISEMGHEYRSPPLPPAMFAPVPVLSPAPSSRSGGDQTSSIRPDSIYTPSNLNSMVPMRPRHTPKDLVMPTPLQQQNKAEDEFEEAWNIASSLLLSSSSSSSSPNGSSYHIPQMQTHQPPTQTQKPQNGRNVLRKRNSAVPPPHPTTTAAAGQGTHTSQTSLFSMMSMSSLNLPPQARMSLIGKEAKAERAPRRLSKRRTDL